MLRRLCVALLGTGIVPLAAFAQGTGDQARLIFTVSAGVVGGSRLWSAGPQPIQFTSPADTFALERRIRSTIAIGFGGAYFPGENLGFTAEGFLVGLGFEDNCRHVFSSGSADMAAVCESIQGRKKAATSVILSGGTMFRLNSRKLISPYGRVNLGLVFSNQSSLRTWGEFPTSSGPSTVEVYPDNRTSRVDPALAIGVGFTAAVAKGYNVRWEIRDNIVGVQRVTGTTPNLGFVPPNERVFKHLFSMTVGFDVVLERRRGRRY
ncbi:MAG: hypothetical protein ACREMZ_07780 [Gemmatimonadales bacterium]